jgi:nucleoside-diphosphate-sugar epimerase
MASYLVTGAAGFIASKVAEFLLDSGETVVGVDDLNTAYDVRLKHWRLAQLKGRPGFTFVEADIRDREHMRLLFEERHAGGKGGVAAVVNLAARAGVRQSVENPWIYFETNATGTLNLLELCRDFGVAKFVLASTSSLYGARNPRPFHEDADTDGPLSPYAASKKAAEALCHTYHYLYGIDVSILRYFTVYGPAGRPDMSLFRFVQWIHEGRPLTLYGDGTQERDFTYVDDVARGTIAALRPLGYEVVNIGSDTPVVLNDAIRLVENLASASALIEREPAHPADVQATWADIGRAERLLGWRPEVDFDEGVTRLVEWYRGNRDWAKQVETR